MFQKVEIPAFAGSGSTMALEVVDIDDGGDLDVLQANRDPSVLKNRLAWLHHKLD